MSELLFWLPVVCGGLVSGASSGLVGVYVVGARIPFIAVCVAHAALAGAVFGRLAGLDAAMMIWPALAAAVLASVTLGALESRLAHVDANLLIGVLFSLSMGLAFLGIGLFGILGRPDSDVRNLLWGSLVFCGWSDVAVMALVAVVLAVYVALFGKELRAILFSRGHAAAAGVLVGPVWTGLLVLIAAVLTVNFQTVGGLMIYSLVTNPALAAIQCVRGYWPAVLLACVLGAACSVAGFAVAAAIDLPTGATIVLLSSVMVGAAMLIRRARS